MTCTRLKFFKVEEMEKLHSIFLLDFLAGVFQLSAFDAAEEEEELSSIKYNSKVVGFG